MNEPDKTRRRMEMLYAALKRVTARLRSEIKRLPLAERREAMLRNATVLANAENIMTLYQFTEKG